MIATGEEDRLRKDIMRKRENQEAGTTKGGGMKGEVARAERSVARGSCEYRRRGGVSSGRQRQGMSRQEGMDEWPS